MNEKKKLMLLFYILLDVILVGAFIYTMNKFGLSTQRDQIFLVIMGIVAITGIVSTVKLLIKIKKNS